MKAWLNQKLADAIREWLHGIRTALGPQLCCEKSGLTAEEAPVLVADVVRSWERELVLCFLYRGSQWRGCIVTIDVLAGIMQRAIETEEVVLIVDMAEPGGCVVDFTPDQDGDTVELLLTAWGAREESANELARILGGVETFRGN